jgi:hypothetical protein
MRRLVGGKAPVALAQTFQCRARAYHPPVICQELYRNCC